MPEPAIRRAGPGDAATLAALGVRTFIETFAHLYDPKDLAQFLGEAYGVEGVRADLDDPAKAAWLVEVDGQAVGYALAGPCALPHPEVTPACGELKRIYFLKDHQGGGVGGRLFEQVVDWLRSQHRSTIWIGVWSENVGAQRFYTRRGFRKVGEYGFAVGRTVDREFILRGVFDSLTATAPSGREDLSAPDMAGGNLPWDGSAPTSGSPGASRP